MFDANFWPISLVGSGQREISNLVTHCQEHNYISQEEKEKSNQWMAAMQKIGEITGDIKKEFVQNLYWFVKKGQRGHERHSVILNIILAVSGSTAAAEGGFWKLNIEKTSICTRLNSKLLSNIICIVTENITEKIFNLRTILKW